MSEEVELFKVHRAGQEKYTYFLLAAAGAAIGFSVTQTNDDSLTWAHSVLFIAMACWAASFFCGCIHLQYVDSSLYGNMDLLKIKRGGFSQIGIDTPLFQNVAIEGIESALVYNSNKASLYGKIQFNLIIFGAVFFLSWHIYEMYLRSLR